MILLLGGTSETASIAEALASAGHRVLVSTATDIPMNIGCHPNITRRHGRLLESDMASLIHRSGILAIVDATHPYAVQARRTAERVAAESGIEYVTFIRPAALPASADVRVALTHQEAAAIAFSCGPPVLLTIGCNNLAPYCAEARRTGGALMVRILPYPASMDACRRAGMSDDQIICGRGPFSLEENRRHILDFNIGVLVTKDSGAAGGGKEKIDAARQEGCSVVVVARPPQPSPRSFCEVRELVEGVTQRIRPGVH